MTEPRLDQAQGADSPFPHPSHRPWLAAADDREPGPAKRGSAAHGARPQGLLRLQQAAQRAEQRAEQKQEAEAKARVAGLTPTSMASVVSSEATFFVDMTSPGPEDEFYDAQESLSRPPLATTPPDAGAAEEASAASSSATKSGTAAPEEARDSEDSWSSPNLGDVPLGTSPDDAFDTREFNGDEGRLSEGHAAGGEASVLDQRAEALRKVVETLYRDQKEVFLFLDMLDEDEGGIRDAMKRYLAQQDDARRAELVASAGGYKAPKRSGNHLLEPTVAMAQRHVQNFERHRPRLDELATRRRVTRSAKADAKVDDWVRVYSEDVGKHYWYSQSLGKSVWTKPNAVKVG
mmetsp:Transcript_29615/g.94956  ORF Transcript_29615/g.94956 Transcript_29615/m.94956 type:complete len:348 (-) Transcript_29615:103-1146(-)|eukprot:CAMPEP_0118870064 /NCGR_PEP_ID=MMETSP1163-20130328/13169_1 /TAXON_ID=124430 /ORGANISM="Phaeomonas parva, Strain CCMP2877" /LENGTH=347 /DNA_ID=CAMNT_0006805007 /DNA_START=225 /DNA_END=1268 /DNA_ORIENTATION=-